MNDRLFLSNYFLYSINRKRHTWKKRKICLTSNAKINYRRDSHRFICNRNRLSFLSTILVFLYRLFVMNACHSLHGIFFAVRLVARIFHYFNHLKKNENSPNIIALINVEMVVALFPDDSPFFYAFLVAKRRVYFVDHWTVSVDMHTAYRTFIFFGLNVSHFFHFIGASLNIPHVLQPNKIKRKIIKTTATSSSSAKISKII